MSTATRAGGDPPSAPISARTQLAVLLFTDIVKSTDLKRQHGMQAYSRAIKRHNAIFEGTAGKFPGMRIVKYTGDGYFATFSTVADAVRFALTFQHLMHVEPWGEVRLTSRLGLHVGEVAVMQVSGMGDIIGLAADLAARLMSLAVGGQILMTRMAFDDARQFLSEHPRLEPGKPAPHLRWLAHGPYLIQGLEEPITVYEVGAEGIAPLIAPPDSEKGKRQVHEVEEPTLGWRPAVGMPVPSRPNWLLEAKIGEGSFGEVWLAAHQTTKDRHVFKFCFDAERLRSFKRELTIFRLIKAALGEREDIVRLHEVKFDEPPYFLESDYSAEGNLCQWAEKAGGISKVPLDDRIEIVCRMAKALAAAHSIGVLHKDIKPANILMQVDSRGKARPQLVDFGIGEISEKAALAAKNFTVTAYNATIGQNSGSSGTPVYMPPEALAGLTWTEQGDIFSLGVVFYQLIAGDLTRPLAGGWERDIPDEMLREDIARCVDGDRAHRLKSASELALRLESLPARRRERAKTLASAQKLARARWISLQLAALVVVLIAVLGVWGWQSKSNLIAAREEQQRQVASGRLAQRANRYLGSANDPAAAALLYTESLAMKRAGGKVRDESADRRRIGCALRAMPRLVAAHLLDRMDYFQVDPSGKCVVVSSRSEYRPASAEGGEGKSGEAQLWFLDGRGIVPLQLAVKGQPDAKISVIRTAFDGTGEHVAAAAEYTLPNDRRIRGVLCVWKVAGDGAPRTPIVEEPFAEPLRDVAFRPGHPGTLAIARRAAEDEPGGRGVGHVSVYDWRARKVVAELPHEFLVNRILFSPDGRRLATASGDPNAGGSETGGECQLLDLQNPDAAPRVLWHQEPVNCISFSADSRFLVTGSGMQNGFHGDAQIWDAATGAAEGQPLRHGGAVMAAEFAPYGDRLLTGSQRDGKARIWTRDSPYPLHVFAHDAHVFSAVWSPDGRSVATGSRDQMARVWDAVSGDLAAPVLYHGGTVSHIRFSAEGRDLLAATQGALRLWDLAAANSGASVVQRCGQARVMGVSSDGAWLAMATEEDSFQQNSEVRLINALTGGERWKTPLRIPGAVRHLAFSPDGARLAIAVERRPTAKGPRGEVRICKVETAQEERLQLEGAPVHVALSSAASQRVLILSKDGKGKVTRVTVWDPVSRIQRDWSQPDFPIDCAALSPDGLSFVTGGGSAEPRKGVAYVVSINDSSAPLSLLARVEHDEAVRAVAFDASGGLLATGAVDDEARVWDLRNEGRLLGRFRHTADLTSVGFYQGGARLLSSSFDGSAAVWDVKSGEKLGTCRHKAVVRHVTASADGLWIATGGDDQAVRVWDAATFEEVATLSHPSAIQAVGFGAKGEAVYGAGIVMPPGVDHPGNRPDVLNTPVGRVEFRSWDFSPDLRDIAELQKECQRLAARRVSTGEQVSMLTQIDSAERKTLLPSPTNTPVHTPDEIAQFHREAAVQSYASGLWPAAAWHAGRIEANREGDYLLKLRAFFRAGMFEPVVQMQRAAVSFRNGGEDTAELRRIIALARSERAKPGAGEQEWAELSEVWAEALRRDPEDTFLLVKRAEVYVRLKRYEEARRDLEKAIEREMKDDAGARLSAWQRLALLYVMDDSRRAQYEELCAKLIERYGSTVGFGAIVAWPRLLRPVDQADSALANQLEALARSAVAEERANPYRLNTLGAALVRAGKFSEAIDTIDEARRIFHRTFSEAKRGDMIRAMKVFGDDECKLLKPEQGRPIDWIFLALAHHGAGNEPLARKWLEFARLSVRSDDAESGAATSNRRVWNDLELDLLLKEAAALIPSE